MRGKGKKRAAAVAVLLMLSVPAAYADGFYVYEWSARGVGMGGAMMFSDEASLIGYNPAAITQFDEKGNVSLPLALSVECSGTLGNLTVTPALLPPYGNEDIIDKITEKLS